MRKYYNILLAPIITEKSNIQKDEAQQVSFKVPITATKIEIKEAVNKVFGKKVINVRTIKVKGKTKRLGRQQGKRPDWKKAIVKLEKGERIEFFEGV